MAKEKRKKQLNILAIETSCDETAAAVVEVQSKSNQLSVISTDNSITNNDVLSTSILSNVIASQIDIHKKFGGIYPEYASRAHCEKIIPVVEEALGNIDPDIIAVTTGPGLIGSLLIGVNFAKTLAFAKNLPIIGINHWLGHIYSCWAGEDVTNSDLVINGDSSQERKSQLITRSKSLNHSLPSFPSLILIASGGHTGLVLMKSHDKIIPLGETLDDAAGEAFDKVAKLLSLGYPGGPAISKAAGKGNPKKYNFPRALLDRKDFDFSFSGLKTAVLYESKKHKLTDEVKTDLASSFQQTLIDILIGKTIQAAYKFRPKSICLCGGVSANKELRGQLKKAVSGLPWQCSYHLPPMELTTDNAAMIGIAAAYHLAQTQNWADINANANLRL